MSRHDQQSFSQRFLLIFFNSLPLLGYTVAKSYILNSIFILSRFDSFLRVLAASCFNFWLLPFFFLYLPLSPILLPKALTKWSTGSFLSSNYFVSLSYQVFLLLAQIHFLFSVLHLTLLFSYWHPQSELLSVSCLPLFTFLLTSHSPLTLSLNILLFRMHFNMLSLFHL